MNPDPVPVVVPVPVPVLPLEPPGVGELEPEPGMVALPFSTTQFSGAPSFWHGDGNGASFSRMSAVLHRRVVAAGQRGRGRDRYVPGDLAVLEEPALDQVLRQRRVAELGHLLLAAAEQEVDAGAERPALGVGEVGGLVGALRGTIR